MSETRGPENRASTPLQGRGYAGVRITAPPKKEGLVEPQSESTGSSVIIPGREITGEQRARILTGSALFGVLLIVFLHEFGHWATGFLITGRAPDFLFVAVRQKVTEFSTFGGIFTWGAGPVVHITALWILTLFVSRKGERYPRLLSATGAAAVFTIIITLFIWGQATFTSSESWGNDLPKVATFIGSAERVWMHLLSATFMAAAIFALRRWWFTIQATGRPAMYYTPALYGTFQGGVFVLIATLFLAIAG